MITTLKKNLLITALVIQLIVLAAGVVGVFVSGWDLFFKLWISVIVILITIFIWGLYFQIKRLGTWMSLWFALLSIIVAGIMIIQHYQSREITFWVLVVLVCMTVGLAALYRNKVGLFFFKLIMIPVIWVGSALLTLIVAVVAIIWFFFLYEPIRQILVGIAYLFRKFRVTMTIITTYVALIGGSFIMMKFGTILSLILVVVAWHIILLILGLVNKAQWADETYELLLYISAFIFFGGMLVSFLIASYICKAFTWFLNLFRKKENKKFTDWFYYKFMDPR